MTNKLTVEQCDRDAAADLHLKDMGEPYSANDRVVATRIADGRHDSWDIVQAFARHRQQAEARAEGLEQALLQARGNLVRALASAMEMSEETVAKMPSVKDIDDALTAYRSSSTPPDDSVARIVALEEALRSVMIGGNHLALLIGPDNLPYTCEPAEALQHYGPSDHYELWCCWRAIMQARAVLGETGSEEGRG